MTENEIGLTGNEWLNGVLIFGAGAVMLFFLGGLIYAICVAAER